LKLLMKVCAILRREWKYRLNTIREH
jgi:hypothetical protein